MADIFAKFPLEEDSMATPKGPKGNRQAVLQN